MKKKERIRELKEEIMQLIKKYNKSLRTQRISIAKRKDEYYNDIINPMKVELNNVTKERDYWLDKYNSLYNEVNPLIKIKQNGVTKSWRENKINL